MLLFLYYYEEGVIMDIEELLKILKQGSEFWNKWRQDNFSVNPDLSGADLREAILTGADLSGADFREADLKEANLSEANLSNANFRESYLNRINLSAANLSGAELTLAILSGANLRKANLSGSDLRKANLSGSDLSEANLRKANLRGANFSEASLSKATLSRANLKRANLSRANLKRANLREADLSGANLRDAYLASASLVQTIFEGANLEGCRIYGISAWDLKLDKAKQLNLVITPSGEPPITVDDLEVAQFIYLLLNNRKIRNVIETVTSKAVLILGRFKPERKAVLDAIREELRKHDYLPILFDFDKPTSKNLTETISTLAHMARFVIADITDAKSIPQELHRIVPGLPSLPVQPIILSSQYEYAMFKDFLDYHWVLLPYRYSNIEDLLDSLETKVIEPAISKADEIEDRRKAIDEQLTKNVP